MTRNRTTGAVLAGAMALLGLVGLVTLPVAAAELPFTSGGAPAAATTVVVDADGLMPGDTLPAISVPVTADHRGPFGLRADVTGSAVFADAIHVHVVTAAGVVLFDGPLTGVAASGEAGPDGELLSVTMQVLTSAGNEIQGQRLAVDWRITETSGLD